MSDSAFKTGTFAAKFDVMLQEHGLWPREAKAILDRLAADKDCVLNEVMLRQIEGYPPQLLNVGWAVVSKMALEYIDEACPKHWARPMFLPAKERDAFLATRKEQADEQATDAS